MKLLLTTNRVAKVSPRHSRSFRRAAFLALLIACFSVLNAQTTNLALGKAALQSSTFASSTTANKAVDGNTDGNFNNGSIMHSLYEAKPWWQVDLGATASITSIEIWNRTDCCLERLSDYWVFVSNTPFLAGDTPETLSTRAGTWNNHQTIQPNPTSVITAGGAQGRYVRVQLSGWNYLKMAEVKVMGQSLPAVMSHLARLPYRGARFRVTLPPTRLWMETRTATSITVPSCIHFMRRSPGGRLIWGQRPASVVSRFGIEPIAVQNA